MSARSPDLTPEDVRRVARLARLEVPDDQVDRYREELGAVLEYVERLRALDLEGVEPLTHVGDGRNRLDDDTPGPTLGNDVAMGLAPRAEPPFFSVPRVLGEGGGA